MRELYQRLPVEGEETRWFPPAATGELRLDGRVVERGTGAPVGKVSVKLSGGEVFKAYTGDDGRFVLPHVAPGKSGDTQGAPIRQTGWQA